MRKFKKYQQTQGPPPPPPIYEDISTDTIEDPADIDSLLASR